MADKISRANSLLKEAAELLNPTDEDSPPGPSTASTASRPTGTGSSSVISSVFNVQEFMPRATGRRRNARSTPYEKKGRAGMTWTHKFVCLGQTAVESVPNPQDKYTLKQADLGEKKLVFKLNGDYVHLKEVILQSFPLLVKAGGFELHRTDGPYSRALIPIEQKFFTSVAKLKSYVVQARVYIRPVQADIMDIFGLPCETGEGTEPKERCLECGKEVEISYLKTHIEVCKEASALCKKEKEKGKDSDSCDSLPPTPPTLAELLRSSARNAIRSGQPDQTPTPPTSSACSTTRSGRFASAYINLLEEGLPDPTPPTLAETSACSTTRSEQPVRFSSTGYSAYVDLLEEDLPAEYEPELQMALEASLATAERDFSMQEVDTPEIVKQHVSELNIKCGVEDPHQQLTVRRKHLWEDIKRCFSKPYTNVLLPLRVTFVGESGADEGGPKREFFRLALESCIGNSSLFTGSTYEKVLLHNTTALLQKHYKYVGHICAMSIVQGGPGPMCFSSWVYDYLAEGLDGVVINVSDVLVDSVKDFLGKVALTTDVTTLRELLREDPADVVFECGFSKSITQVSLEDVPMLHKAIAINSCLVPIKAELDQMKEGLRLFNVDGLLKKYPAKMKKLFVVCGSPARLSLAEFMALTEYNYSVNGSNDREAEESTTMNWVEFLAEIENGLAVCTVHSIDGGNEEHTLSLEDILVFATGADRVPPMGFHKMVTIDFDRSNIFPTASTCSLTMYLPMATTMMSYDQFKTGMIEGLVSGFGFGQA